MLQDIAPKQYHVKFREEEPKQTSPCFVFRDKELLERKEGGGAMLPTFGDLRDSAEKVRYLFRIDEDAYYLVSLTEDFVPTGYTYQNFRIGGKEKAKDLYFAETIAYQLSVWYQDNRFCGRCGTETEPNHRERMLCCPRCGNQIYPKIAPAIVVAVTDRDRLLMTRYNHRAYKGYALIAGFTEVGETAEQTVEREVMEEVGLRVKNIRYYGSQPWGTDSNLLIGFFAALDGSAKIRMDQEELSQARWYRRQEITVKPDGYSITNAMIQSFLRGDWR